MTTFHEQLSAGQRRALLSIAEGPGARVRSDVVHRLQQAGLIVSKLRPYQLTDLGRAAVDELRAFVGATQPAPADLADVIGVMLQVDPGSAPERTPGAVARMLLDLASDADRVAALAWLASPRGAAYLADIRTGLIVASLTGRSYAEAATHLGISYASVNKAVTRTSHGRQPELDTPHPRGDDLTGKAVTPDQPTEG